MFFVAIAVRPNPKWRMRKSTIWVFTFWRLEITTFSVPDKMDAFATFHDVVHVLTYR